MTRHTTVLLITVLTLAVTPEASALIEGGVGNEPLTDPGWPTGAAAIFNHQGRVAWWVGPPYGGGEWHAECRGDARALNAVLADFAKVDAKIRRVVVLDGAGQSFWLVPNREPEKLATAKIDWVFEVWEPARWERLHALPAGRNPTRPGDTSPPAEIDVFTAGIDWASVRVPEGIEVIDNRLVAHGFSAADGVVLEGRVTDLATGQPLAATIRLERVEPQPKGGYLYPVVAESKADAQGRWLLKRAPAGWMRVVAEADGFVPRVVGYGQLDEQPRWQSYESALARPGPVAGRVTDQAGKPLPDVEVQLHDVEAESGGRYEAPGGSTSRTDAEGRFRAEQVPVGKATIWLHKAGYCRPGLGLPIATPRDDVELQMTRSSFVRVTVDFTGKERPAGYLVEMTPEGGNVIGSYGGSGNLDATNRMEFQDVPPGRYVLRGHPNPSSSHDQTEPVTVDLKGGERSEVTLKAK